MLYGSASFHHHTPSMTARPEHDSDDPKTTAGPWCSVIIPTLNEAGHLPSTLRLLSPALQCGEIEVIVCDGGSTDDSVRISRSYGCTTIHCTRGRARQMNAGARTASTPYLWFLHADTLPPDGWLEVLRSAKASEVPACFSLRFDGERNSVWLRLFGRMSGWDVPAFRFGDQSLFISASLFRRIDGYREELRLLEDNDVVRRARRAGAGFRVLDGKVTTSSRRYERHGVVFTQTVYVLLYGMFRAGVPQRRLGRVFDWAFREN